MKKLNVLTTLYVATGLLLMTGCTGAGGGGGVSGGGGGGSSSSFTLSVSTIQGLDSTTWTSDGTSVYTNHGTVTITGVCSRGIATITATVNAAPVAENATCTGVGTFTWVKTFSTPTALTGDAYDIVFKGLAADNSQLAVASDTNIKVDDQPPSNPVVTPGAALDPGTGYYVFSSAPSSISGTSAGDPTIHNVTCSASAGDCGSFSFSTPSIVENDTLTAGTAKTYTFVAYDFAGNASSGVSVTLLFSPVYPAAVVAFNNNAISVVSTGTSGGYNGTNGKVVGGVAPFGAADAGTNGAVWQGSSGIISNVSH